jgi:hypothetical protein
MQDGPFAPKSDSAAFARVRAAVEAAGPAAGADAACAEAEAAGDYQALFYGLLVKSRLGLGVNPFPLSPAAELPAEAHEGYEEAIRTAARHVGGLLLAKGDISRAWAYYRIIQDPVPVRDALTAHTPGPDDDIYPLVDIAWQQGLLPEKGFDWVLDRSGICSTITMVSATDFTTNPGLRDYCVKRLVRSLHEQLTERLAGDLDQRGTRQPDGATIPSMLLAHPEVMADDAYHTDTSHLSSVVQAAMQLPPGCDELQSARDLALYGTKLSPTFAGNNDPPFEKTYDDYLPYLSALAGIETDANVRHFTDKLPAAAAEGYQYPAAVAVNLLVQLGRLPEALAVAREYLADAEEGSLPCPGVLELARRAKDYDTLAEVAQARGDIVSYLAALSSLSAKRAG